MAVMDGSRRFFNRLRPLDPSALFRRMDGRLQIGAALSVEPEIGGVAKDACQHERPIGCNRTEMAKICLSACAACPSRFKFTLHQTGWHQKLFCQHLNNANQLTDCLDHTYF